MHGRDVLRSIPLLPRNAVLAFLAGYRKVVSPMYGDVCAYYPSCSAYAVGAVQQHGAVRGLCSRRGASSAAIPGLAEASTTSHRTDTSATT